ncbi:hypothetical protein BDN71DRAFT_242971 [Pleurotus eryngii]|uniref:Uncharacterized protein n=1 Tax=Pleurotus eryngii TaxID=5323 RepID=A0A9P5ZM10_PLEER|nr:hypothetical protein BDN71DRAFT_242971 [Pleurotus eryngii]
MISRDEHHLFDVPWRAKQYSTLHRASRLLCPTEWPSFPVISRYNGRACTNLGMMSCIRAPLIRTIKLLHTGEASLIPLPPIIASAYSNLLDLPDSYSRFKLQPVLRYSSQCRALVRVWTGCAVEE